MPKISALDTGSPLLKDIIPAVEDTGGAPATVRYSLGQIRTLFAANDTGIVNAAEVVVADTGAAIGAANVEDALHENRDAIDAIEADYLTSTAIGSTVQGFDADTAKTDVDNEWSATQTVKVSGTLAQLSLERTDTHGSPVNISALNFIGRDAGANNTFYARFIGVARDDTEGSEDGGFQVQTFVAGTLAARMEFGAGQYMTGATGGDQGAGTVNAVGVYDDGVLLTDIVQEAISTGSVDVDKWDALVPDIEIPEARHQRPVMEEVEVVEPRYVPDADGSLIRRPERRRVSRQVVALVPVYDENGKGIEAIEKPLFEDVTTPAQTIERKHFAAHMLKDMMSKGFKPGDYRSLRGWLRQTNTLAGMPSSDEWGERSGKISLGEMQTRAWMAKEIILCAMCNLADTLDTLESRVSILEGENTSNA